jgi:hypothetical protein
VGTVVFYTAGQGGTGHITVVTKPGSTPDNTDANKDFKIGSWDVSHPRVAHTFRGWECMRPEASVSGKMTRWPGRSTITA